MGKPAITHDQLVKVGCNWLANKCRIVADEIRTSVGETPDIIGWNGSGNCWVIEVKTSRMDFFANARKSHERNGYGVGNERWFLTPKGLVNPDEVPEGWGLLEYNPSGHSAGYFIKRKVQAPRRQYEPRSLRNEKLMLVSIAGRALEAASRLKPLWLGEEGEEVEG
jgi:hypothetical protein